MKIYNSLQWFNLEIQFKTKDIIISPFNTKHGVTVAV